MLFEVKRKVSHYIVRQRVQDPDVMHVLGFSDVNDYKQFLQRELAIRLGVKVMCRHLSKRGLISCSVYHEEDLEFERKLVDIVRKVEELFRSVTVQCMPYNVGRLYMVKTYDSLYGSHVKALFSINRESDYELIRLADMTFNIFAARREILDTSHVLYICYHDPSLICHTVTTAVMCGFNLMFRTKLGESYWTADTNVIVVKPRFWTNREYVKYVANRVGLLADYDDLTNTAVFVDINLRQLPETVIDSVVSRL